jgi:hypothetical protein
MSKNINYIFNTKLSDAERKSLIEEIRSGMDSEFWKFISASIEENIKFTNELILNDPYLPEEENRSLKIYALSLKSLLTLPVDYLAKLESGPENAANVEDADDGLDPYPTKKNLKKK